MASPGLHNRRYMESHLGNAGRAGLVGRGKPRSALMMLGTSISSNRSTTITATTPADDVLARIRWWRCAQSSIAGIDLACRLRSARNSFIVMPENRPATFAGPGGPSGYGPLDRDRTLSRFQKGFEAPSRVHDLGFGLVDYLEGARAKAIADVLKTRRPTTRALPRPTRHRDGPQTAWCRTRVVAALRLPHLPAVHPPRTHNAPGVFPGKKIREVR